MTTLQEQLTQLTPLQRATLAVKMLRDKVDALEHSRSEPIAVIGMACRFPGGANSPAAFWDLLRHGVDACSEIPRERWDLEALYDPTPGVPGKMYTRRGGFIDQVDCFDPQFFRMTPREVVGVDPQQRLLLEVAWEALEHAGQPPDQLIGSQTGVFLGISTNDYSVLLNNSMHSSSNNAQSGAGNAASVASGRLSYSFGFQGPCISIDTACSSSLVAAHLAVQSLRNDECALALVAGVNLMLTPQVTINFCQARLLSPDGKCKTFDASADGYVRGEGCGVLVLKRLSDAQASGDRILALIRGSAVNQDGRSSGLTAPNGRAQEAVIRQALSNAGVSPTQVSHIEAHGTGTALGDPIEVQALATVYGQGRASAQPLYLGAVKTNIGHLEAGAGVASLIKMTLSLMHREIPPLLHFNTLNPHISFDGLPAMIPTTTQPWAVSDGPRLAGISSFGFSGTNVHVLMEEAPTPEAPCVERERPAHLLGLSAKSEAGLKDVAHLYETHLATSTDALADVCYMAHTGRSHFNYRLAVVADDLADARSRLTDYRAEVDTSGIIAGHCGNKAPRVAFLFSGQGAQYTGMGRALYETLPRFRAVLDQCAALLREHLDRPLLSVLFEDSVPIHQTIYAQPALFAFEVALAEAWRSLGIEPCALLGHSVGEYAAACVAGVFDLETGLRFMAARGRLMQTLPSGGAMVAALVEVETVRQAMSAAGDGLVALAAENGPRNTVISGDGAAVRRVVEKLEAEGVSCRALTVSHAFHSPLLDPILDEFEHLAAGLSYQQARSDIFANLTGCAQRSFDAAYWRQHARQPVRFADGMRNLVAQGCDVLLEVGPHPVLIGLGRHCVEGHVWVPSQRRDTEGWRTFLEGLGQLYVRGAGINWAGLDDGPRRKVTLPTYPFQRQRYWVETAPSQPEILPAVALRGKPVHPLLGYRLRLPGTSETRFESVMSADSPAFLAEHCVYAEVVLPATGYLEMALAAAAEVFGAGSYAIEDMAIPAVLSVPQGASRLVQIVIAPIEDGTAPFCVVSLAVDDATDRALEHARGRLRVVRGSAGRAVEPVAALQARCQEVSVEAFYRGLAEHGVRYGPRFRNLEQLWCGYGEALGRIVPSQALATEPEQYYFHPALLDTCLHVIGAALPSRTGADAYLPFGVECLRFFQRPHGALWCQVQASETGDTVTGNVLICDDTNQAVAAIDGFTLRRVSQASLHEQARHVPTDWLYDLDWQPQRLTTGLQTPHFLPSPAAVVTRLRPLADTLAVEHGLAVYDAMADELDRVSLDYVVAALQRLGFEFTPNRRFTVNALAEDLDIADQHRRLFARLLEMLAEDGILQRNYALWQIAQPPPASDPDATCAALFERYPACRAELALLRRCGAKLAEVLKGDVDPLRLLFPADGADGAGALYQDSPYALAVNILLGEALRIASEHLPQERVLRILEIGAGTGSATAAVLPRLDPERTHYAFTDISRFFTAKAAETFAAYPYMSYRTLDIETDPAAQGFAGDEFDLILAANVLHATRDLRDSLGHVKQLLAAEGLLVLLESTERRRWVDLIFGLTDGWWRFEDDELRPSHPLLSRSQWCDLLTTCGFAEVEALPGGELILARAPVQEQADAGTWLVLADRTGLGAALAECLIDRGGQCVTLQSHAQDDLPTVLRSRPFRGVIHMWGLDAVAEPGATSLLPEQSMACGSAVSLVQMLAALPEPGRLWLVTRGAMPLSGGPVAIAQTPLWGLGRVIALEHPDLRCTRIDLDPAAPEIAALATEILGQDLEDQVAFRAGVRHVARLVRHQGRPGTPMAMRVDQTYLVTGGLGGLGLAVARWMVERGARYLALLGRSAPGAEAAETVQELREAGAEVVILQADVARQDELERALVQMQALLPPLAGVIHAAGTLNDAPLVVQDWERFASVMAAKCDGAWHLHCLTHDIPLDFFVLFSSAVAVLGAVTQANHAAANAFLDGLAHYRRALGLPAISINWGVWSRIGAAARRHVDAHTARHGMGVITPEQGVAMLEHLLAEQRTQVVVLPDVDWPRFLSQFPEHTPLSMFAALEVSTEAQVETDHGIDVSQTDLPQRIRQAPVAERQALMTAYLSEQVAQVTGLKGALDPEVSFSDLGFDSLMAVELKHRVEGGLGVELPVSKMLEGVSVVEVGRLLLEALPRAGEAMALPKARVIVPDPAQRYEPFPLTDMQGAYWVGRQADIELGNIGCHLYTEVEAGEVDITRLELVWRRLIERHEMLRAVFTPDGQQRILEWVPPYQIEVLDLRHQDPAVVEARLHELRAHLSHRVFNPEEWPLFDIRATRIDERTVILHIGFDLLILDAASIFQLRAEWARLYNDLDISLPPLTLSFRDYVLEEVAYRETDAYREAEAYWKERLPTLPGGPELPLARNPSAITKPHFVRHLGQIEAQDWERLRARARQAGLTPSSLLCAAYADVLAAWSKNAQFCLTLTLFNRPAIHPEIFDIVGDFTATILVEVDARGATFAARAKKLHERLIANLDHSAYSGVRVMRDLSRVRKEVLATVPAVFTSAFGFRGGPYEGDNRTIEAHNKEELGKMVYSVAQTPQVWIDHQVSEFAGGLLFTWDVVAELFPEGVVDAMFKAYCDLLRDLAADADVWHRPLATLVPTTHLERRAAANATAAPVPEVLLHELFAAQAQQRPAQIAVVDARARLTYGELDAKSNGLAWRLRALGVQPNQLVAVIMEKGWEQAVAVLGVLKAGAAYLPIAPVLPAARQRYLLENGDVAMILTQSWLQPDSQGMMRLDVDTIEPSTEPLLMVQQPGDLAYVIYTSGSTGLPKGVMIDHRGAANTVLDINQRFGVGPDDRVLALSSLSFDLSVYDIFGVLAAGGTIVLPEEAADRDPSRWLELVHREGVTVWNSVPALMSMAAEYGQPLGDTVRLVMLSGDWIPLSLPERIWELAPRARVISLGGATEASIWSIYYPVETVDPAWHSVPYGWPLVNQSFHVLNERLEPCPEWVTGQLFIGGIGLAQGYWKDADKTAERFMYHPVTGERLYATSDLGRYRPDGTIEFLGREDFQVKVQGHRIELGEIEAALEAHPGVRAAVVSAVGATRTDKRLVAFVVSEHAPAADAVEDSEAVPLLEGVEPDAATRLWDVAVTTGRAHTRAVSISFQPEDAEVLKGHLDSFYRDAVTHALRRLGVFTRPGQRYTVDDILEHCAIKPRYRRWLSRAITALADNGTLHQEGNVFACTAPLPETTPNIAVIQGFDAFGFTPADFTLLHRVVDNLPDILTERLHSADIYTAEETPGIYETLFQHTHPVVREIVGTVADAGERLRVLEVGGGVGSTARTVLPRLPAERITYHFTDISAYFLQAAQRAFADYTCVSYGLLDIEQPPEEQGYAPQSFDVIIATSVLHATRDVAESLRHLRTLLAPGGLLVLVEETRFYSWFDLSMGLQQGFDRFTDTERRRAHPLLSQEQWRDVLTVTGFAHCALLGQAGSVADALGFHVILAQAPQASASVTPANLRVFLRQRLPEYMVPAHLVLLPELPLTPNGKVDRQALVAQHITGTEERAGFELPQSEDEKKVAAIWCEALGVEKVGRHDSFFDLGGDSLNFIQIHNQLRRVFQRDIPVADIFRHPTVAGIADLLQGRSAKVMREPLEGLVTIQAEGDRIPLFVVPGVISTPQYLRDLVPYLGLDQPLYGWQAPGITGGEPLRTIEEQAAFYLRSLRVVQPHGPYLIAGYSFGGYPAFELAQQLQREGDEVALLLLVDTVVIRSQLTIMQDVAVAKGSIVRAYYAGFAEQLPIPYEEMRQRDPHEQFDTVLRQLKELGLVASNVLLDGLLAVFQANFRAMTQYVIEAYPSQITLFRTVGGFPEEFHEHESTESLEDPALGWSQYAALPVEVHSIPGSHMTMMKPRHIDVQMAALKSCIDKATRGLSA
jgi:amino acid adenylation domain-containing protein